MRVETKARLIPLGKRAITILSIDNNNKAHQKFLMSLMLGVYVLDSLLYFVLLIRSSETRNENDNVYLGILQQTYVNIVSFK
ncbi:hypothetical protein BUY96_06830 [Staphylococcus gallinarum]|nr:hypothetical protein BUY96_06830 [Staphylococcus gallinarum]